MRDYTDLIKRLNEYSAEHEMHGGITAEAADAIEELAAYEKIATDEHNRAAKMAWERRWIPVTEEPPLKVGDDGYNGYLVYANGYCEVADYTTDKFVNIPHFNVNGDYEPDVTHWMPLPHPPKM